jgi:hypothetical protein
MKLEIVSTRIKFSYDIAALNSLLRQVEATIMSNSKVFAAVLEATNRKMTATARQRYGPDVSDDKLMKALQPGEPPTVTPMHLMYAAGGKDPDWVMRLSNESPPRILVLSEVLVMWQKKQTNYVLTRQLISIISMGLVNYLLDINQLVVSSDRDIMFHAGGTPSHLAKFAHKAFSSLGWSRFQFCPVRGFFDAAGYTTPFPNAAATHP